MSRVRLIHWNDVEAKKRERQLFEAGYDVVHQLPRTNLLHELRADPPSAVVIDLSRLPSQGRDCALAIRQTKALRHVPLVFVTDNCEKAAAIKKLLPDATFASWKKIRSSLKHAIANPPVEPVVPPSRMAGYSGTPLPKKLGIEEGSVVATIAAPPARRETS
ncbi:MAG: hypothetical protein ACE5HT_07175 [Gemmatimonadales bacterium]